MPDDDIRPPFKRPANLLDELESIKGTLNRDDDEISDIPLLDDMVINHLNDNATLLDIERIFEEHTFDESAVPEPAVQFPRFTLDVAVSDDAESTPQSPHKVAASSVAASPPKRSRVHPDYSREVLIQELVDEFIPQIEAELHKRLQQLDDDALRRLKDSK